MKASRETYVAMLVGFGTGFLVAATIFFLPKIQNKQTPTDVTTLMRREKGTPPISSQPFLTIKDPADNLVASDSEVVVSGKTKPKATVVIQTETTDTLIEADENGNFKSQVAIIEGPSEILITAYADENTKESIRKLVYYVDQTISNEEEQ